MMRILNQYFLLVQLYYKKANPNILVPIKNIIRNKSRIKLQIRHHL